MTKGSNTQVERKRLLDMLMATIHDLPSEQIAQVSDFADYLQTKHQKPYPLRGSAEAILHAIDEVGPLQFEPNELDELLTDIDQMRALNLDEID